MINYDSSIATLKALPVNSTQWITMAVAIAKAICGSAGTQFNDSAKLDSVTIGSDYPTGSFMDFAMDAIPPGWVPCDGRSLSKTEYSSLFNVCGTRYGSDTSSTFRVPDSRRRQVIGRTGSAVGGKSGREVARMKEENLPSHTHADSSMTLHPVGPHGHRDRGSYGDGQGIQNSSPEATIIGFVSPRFVSANTPNSVSVTDNFQSNTRASVYSQSSGTHPHTTTTSQTDHFGESAEFGSVSPVIVLQKAIKI